jgi:hypothetical protein
VLLLLGFCSSPLRLFERTHQPAAFEAAASQSGAVQQCEQKGIATTVITASSSTSNVQRAVQQQASQGQLSSSQVSGMLLLLRFCSTALGLLKRTHQPAAIEAAARQSGSEQHIQWRGIATTAITQRAASSQTSSSQVSGMLLLLGFGSTPLGLLQSTHQPAATRGAAVPSRKPVRGIAVH